jgi:2-polyprenyl-3-methyl-5-hydroxy-6-metoxy-1,4-benzoquinol methylase
MSLLLRMLRRLALLSERGLSKTSVPCLPLPVNRVTKEAAKRYLQGLDVEGRDYLDLHLERLAHTIQRVPPASSHGAEVLELGCYGHVSAILHSELSYNVRGAYLGPAGRTDRRTITAGGEKVADLLIDLFDAERDAWPYANDRFDGVLVCEVIEHLMCDPMWMLWEANRVLKPGGWIFVTTPNCTSYRSLERALLHEENPQVFSRYNSRDVEEPPHVREYTPKELAWALEAAGFAVCGVETEREPGVLAAGWVEQVLATQGLPRELRGEQIYCMGVKREAPNERYPLFLYT